MTRTDPQTGLKVAYLGPSASFSEAAAIEAFNTEPNTTYYPLPSFKDVFSSIQDSSTLSTTSNDYAVIPIENSTNGGVMQVLDLMIQCGITDPCLFPDIEVIAEHYLSVHHCLYINPNSLQNTTPSLSTLNITSLYTHPQVWGQCNNFLSTHFPLTRTERIDMPSTSAAATLIATLPSAPFSTPAAICSSLAGQRHKLQLLASSIEDQPGQNTTRFLIIRNRHHRAPLPARLLQPLTPRPKYYKSLLTFTVPHREPGSLAAALAVIKRGGYNLTNITTRPSRLRNWHYVFFVECQMQADGGEPGVKEVLSRELSEVTERMAWLGSWVDRMPMMEG